MKKLVSGILLFSIMSSTGFSNTKGKNVNPTILKKIEQRSEETSTTGLIIWQKGKLLAQYGENKKVPLYSMTKSFVSLAIGLLFDESKINSLDTPVREWFPDRKDWQEGKKAKVTLRMLMTHNSGIEDHFINSDGSFNNEKFMKFEHTKDILDSATRLEATHEPGTHAVYSNSSADILVTIVNKLAGKRVDAYIDEKIFKPLEITNWQWVSSTKQIFGTDDNIPSGADGLVLTASDLLKVGVMVLQNGEYGGKRIISQKWIQLMASEIPQNPMTIELGEAALTKVKDPSVPGKYLHAMDQGKNIPFEKYASALLWLVPQSLIGKKPAEVFMGWGFLGQYLMILPEKQIIAVRLYTEGLPNLTAHEDNTRVSFPDFEYWVRKLN